MAGATLQENFRSPIQKQSDDYVSRKIKSSRQHARFCGLSNSPLSWDNSLSETWLGESYIVTIYRHLDAKEKHFLDVEGV